MDAYITQEKSMTGWVLLAGSSDKEELQKCVSGILSRNPIMTIREISKELHIEFLTLEDKNVVSVGYSDDTIYIYTKGKVTGYPDLYLGVPVIVKRIGSIRPL